MYVLEGGGRFGVFLLVAEQGGVVGGGWGLRRRAVVKQSLHFQQLLHPAVPPTELLLLSLLLPRGVGHEGEEAPTADSGRTGQQVQVIEGVHVSTGAIAQL